MNILDITANLPLNAANGTYHRRAGAPTVIVVHHSASRADVTPAEIAAYQIGPPDNFPGIGYHFLVYADGTVYQTNDIMTLSYHAGDGTDSPLNTNRTGVGVCLVGDFTHDPPPAEQLDATRELIAYLGLPFIPHREAYNTVTSCPGDTWDQWKGELQKEAKVGCLLNYVQIQNPNVCDPLANWINESHIKELLVLDPDAGYNAKVALTQPTYARFYFSYEADKQLIWQGAAGAEEWVRWIGPRIRASHYKLIGVLSPNEPAVKTVEQAYQLAAFLARARYLVWNMFGLRLIEYNAPEGNPEPEIWKYMAETLSQAWAIGLHEYRMNYQYQLPATQDGWHMCRHRLMVREFKAMGLPIPDIFTTEHGFDAGGRGDVDGWREWVSANEAVLYTVDYETACLADGYVKKIFNFIWRTYDGQWTSFENWRSDLDFCAPFAKHILSHGGIAPMDKQQIVSTAETHVIAQVPDFALYKYITGNGLVLSSGEFSLDGWIYQWAFDPGVKERILYRTQAPNWTVEEYYRRSN